MRSRWLILVVCILSALALFIYFSPKMKNSEVATMKTEPSVEIRQPAQAPAELPKARPLADNPYAPKEIADDNIYKEARKRATPSPKLKPLLTGKRWEIRGNKYSLMENTVALDAENAPKGVAPVGEAQGLLLFNKADVDEVNGEKYLPLYEERYGRVVILTGNVKIEADQLPPLPAELTLAQGFPNLNLYFLKTSASSYSELTERLALAQSLPGVRNAVLDLVESRFIPK